MQRIILIKPASVGNAVMLVMGIHMVIFLYILDVAAGKQLVIGIGQHETLAIRYILDMLHNQYAAIFTQPCPPKIAVIVFDRIVNHQIFNAFRNGIGAAASHQT